MGCLSCKSGDVQDAKTTYFAQIKHGSVIIENVPCKKCNQCGDEYFSALVLEWIADILEQLEKIASKIFILGYATAA